MIIFCNTSLAIILFSNTCLDLTENWRGETFNGDIAQAYLYIFHHLYYSCSTRLLSSRTFPFHSKDSCLKQRTSFSLKNWNPLSKNQCSFYFQNDGTTCLSNLWERLPFHNSHKKRCYPTYVCNHGTWLSGL